jgi:SH3-like domain-containing protein
VPADRIKATLAADTLRAGPRANARVVASLRGTRGGFPLTPDSVAVKRLVSCQGQWVQAETEFGTGWVSRVCGRQLERC